MTAVKYMHHTPGRLRIRGQQFKRPGEATRKAVALLQALEGVDSVRHNVHAGSLTIHYDPQVKGQTDLLAALEQAGCVHGRTAVEAASPAARIATGEGVAGLFGKALMGALAQRAATRVIGVLL